MLINTKPFRSRYVQLALQNTDQRTQRSIAKSGKHHEALVQYHSQYIRLFISYQDNAE